MLATANTGKNLERFWKKNAGEWTGSVEISKKEIPGSKRSMYGYILTDYGLNTLSNMCVFVMLFLVYFFFYLSVCLSVSLSLSLLFLSLSLSLSLAVMFFFQSGFVIV